MVALADVVDQLDLVPRYVERDLRAAAGGEVLKALRTYAVHDSPVVPVLHCPPQQNAWKGTESVFISDSGGGEALTVKTPRAKTLTTKISVLSVLAY